jgi:rhodanese-related sulfurtransferase
MFGLTHHNELKAMIDRNDEFVLLDVRPQEFFLKGSLPGAENIPFHDDNFAVMVKKMLPEKSTPVVIYCQNADCQASAKAAAQLAEMGYKNVSDYEKGYDHWLEMGYSLDR